MMEELGCGPTIKARLVTWQRACSDPLHVLGNFGTLDECTSPVLYDDHCKSGYFHWSRLHQLCSCALDNCSNTQEANKDFDIYRLPAVFISSNEACSGESKVLTRSEGKHSLRSCAEAAELDYQCQSQSGFFQYSWHNRTCECALDSCKARKHAEGTNLLRVVKCQ